MTARALAVLTSQHQPPRIGLTALNTGLAIKYGEMALIGRPMCLIKYGQLLCAIVLRQRIRIVTGLRGQ